MVPAEDLLVDPLTSGVANVAIFVRRRQGVTLPVHPDFGDPKLGPAVLIRQRGFRFEPHVAIARVGQPVALENADPAAHNPIFESLTGKNRTFQQHLKPSHSTEFYFKASESLPVSLRDNYFPWMQGLVIVRDNPYAAVTGVDGKFEIEKLPAGELEFKVCHDTGWVQQATLGGKPVEWPIGVAKFEIKPGKNDLGEILVKLEPLPDAEEQ
jgi:hypothetical protein